MTRAPSKEVHETHAHEHDAHKNGADEAHELHLEANPHESPDDEVENEDDADIAATIATVGVVGIGVAIVEAALKEHSRVEVFDRILVPAF